MLADYKAWMCPPRVFDGHNIHSQGYEGESCLAAIMDMCLIKLNVPVLITRTVSLFCF
jgi:hypothetical protein